MMCLFNISFFQFGNCSPQSRTGCCLIMVTAAAVDMETGLDKENASMIAAYQKEEKGDKLRV